MAISGAEEPRRAQGRLTRRGTHEQAAFPWVQTEEITGISGIILLIPENPQLLMRCEKAKLHPLPAPNFRENQPLRIDGRPSNGKFSTIEIERVEMETAKGATKGM
jgi:hypothetical protein